VSETRWEPVVRPCPPRGPGYEMDAHLTVYDGETLCGLPMARGDWLRWGLRYRYEDLPTLVARDEWLCPDCADRAEARLEEVQGE